MEYNSIIWLPRNKYTIVDNENFGWLSQWKWRLQKAKFTFYAFGTAGSKKQISMHRLINQTPEGLFTDHKNGNGLDNRKENLRTATPAQNCMNTRIFKNNRHGYKGVRKDGTMKTYAAVIYVNTKAKHYSGFATAEDAARFYDSKAKELFGEYAKTNEMQGLLPPLTDNPMRNEI